MSGGPDQAGEGPLLGVRGLQVSFATEYGIVSAVDGVSFELNAGEVLAIVGESGCGKSATGLTVMGLTSGPNAAIEGSVRYRGQELVGADEAELRRVRGEQVAMVFQDPMTSLDPVWRVGDQIAEQIVAHREMSAHDARTRAVQLLGSVGIPEPQESSRAFPHEFSGGMRQRAMIAMALSLEPSILIADEPTTALDVTIQAQVLRLVADLNRDRGLAVILITHDLGVVAEIAGRVLVMYAGRVVEQGTLDDIFYDPQHPYTWGLLGSLARPDRPRPDRLPSIAGRPPSLITPPTGCRFRPRCPHEFDRCLEVPPLEVRLADRPGHADSCWLEPERKRALREVEGRIGLGAT